MELRPCGCGPNELCATDLATIAAENARQTLPENAKKLFVLYAEDAGNWGGVPLVNGNVTLLSKSRDRGLLVHLKRAGLITTVADKHRVNGCLATNTFLNFTDAGRAYAAAHGIDISE